MLNCFSNKMEHFVGGTGYNSGKLNNPYIVKQMDDSNQDFILFKKVKRMRSAFTTDQVNFLEKTFKKCPYVDSTQRKEVASALNISERAVKIWFQNRRMKEKKESNTKEGYEDFAISQNIYFVKNKKVGQVTSTNDVLSSLAISDSKEVTSNSSNADQSPYKLPSSSEKKLCSTIKSPSSSSSSSSVIEHTNHNRNNLVEEKQKDECKLKSNDIQQTPIDLSTKSDKVKEDSTESMTISQSQSYMVPGIFKPLNLYPLLKRTNVSELKDYYEYCESDCSCKCHKGYLPVPILLQSGSYSSQCVLPSRLFQSNSDFPS